MGHLLSSPRRRGASSLHKDSLWSSVLQRSKQASLLGPRLRGDDSWGVAGLIVCALIATVGAAQAADDTVGLWIKNTAPAVVVVSVDGAEVCRLDAPIYAKCGDPVITKLNPTQKMCTTNNLKISCITNVKASGVDVLLRRGDGVEYKVRAAKGGTLYLCVEPKALTDCFGKKLH
jgi:hypothetical protein